jgi:[acyl-carrier-protein] S-malonyltransferase
MDSVSVVVVAPGQGSQTPGFLEPWLAEPRFADHLGALADAAHLDLRAHGTVSDAETIRDTAVAQPLIVAASLLAFAAVAEGRREKLAGVAGHSVGELAAAAAAGILSESDAMVLVRERGQAMAKAAAAIATGMSAVIGGDEAELITHLYNLGLSPANYNGGGQLVVAGELPALAALSENPPTGARVIPLQVAGAFHTQYMQPAVDHLATIASGLTVSDPTLTIWTNRDGSTVSSGAAFIDLLVGQVANPVRWDLCMAAFEKAGVTGLVELAPAGALVGLAKRGLKGLPTVAVKTPDDISAAIDLIENS